MLNFEDGIFNDFTHDAFWLSSHYKKIIKNCYLSKTLSTMAPEAEFFSIVNRHFSIANQHFSIANEHFSIANRQFWASYFWHFCASYNFDTSALRIFDTSALYIMTLLVSHWDIFASSIQFGSALYHNLCPILFYA